jgi:hypothetical protein
MQLAIRQGLENPVDRAIHILEAALGDVIVIIERQAAKKEWPSARRQERLLKIREPVEALAWTARAARRDTTITAGVTQMCSLADEVLESARQVIDDQSTDYTLDEVDEELELMARRGQRLRELLANGKRDGFTGHPEFEEAQRAVLGEVQAQVTGAEAWLEKVRDALYAATVATRRTRAEDNRRARAEMAPVLMRVIPATQLPNQETSTRSTVQPSMEWLTSTIADLGMGKRSQQAAGPAGPCEVADALTLLSRTQALTSQSFQQVAEGLNRWKDIEMKHRAKDWPVFDGQVIYRLEERVAGTSPGELPWPAGGHPEEGVGGKLPTTSGQGVGPV